MHLEGKRKQGELERSLLSGRPRRNPRGRACSSHAGRPDTCAWFPTDLSPLDHPLSRETTGCPHVWACWNTDLSHERR